MNSARGQRDPSTLDIVRGWAFDPSAPTERMRIEMLIDNKLVATTFADQFRADLRDSGLGDGYCAFELLIPFEIIEAEEISIELRIAKTGELLNDGQINMRVADAPLNFRQLRKMPDDRLEDRLTRGNRRAHSIIIEQAGELPGDGRPVAIYAINGATILASHRATLEAVRASGYAIVVINSAALDGRPWLAEAGGLADLVILKENEGRDFSSWLTAYFLCKPDIEAGTHVLFLNESLTGPIRDLGEAINKGLAANVEFWALTDSYEQRYHLQSSLFLLSQRGLLSRPFREFVAGYQYPNDKLEVIRQGEIALSECLLSGGLSSAVLCPYEDVCGRWLYRYAELMADIQRMPALAGPAPHLPHTRAEAIHNGFGDYWAGWLRNLSISILNCESRNPQHVFWDILIEDFGYPFMKRELIVFNPAGIPNLSRLFDLIPEDKRHVILGDARLGQGKAPPPLKPRH